MTKAEQRAASAQRAAARRAAGPLPRIMARTERTESGCLLWKGPVNHQGYALGSWGGKNRTLHVAVYTLAHGPVPKGKTLDHTCHTNDLDCFAGSNCLHRRCLEEAHLEPVTPSEQQRRSHRRPSPLTCPHGHLFTPENTRYLRGKRGCKTCHRHLEHARFHAPKGGCRPFQAGVECSPCRTRMLKGSP